MWPLCWITALKGTGTSVLPRTFTAARLSSCLGCSTSHFCQTSDVRKLDENKPARRIETPASDRRVELRSCGTFLQARPIDSDFGWFRPRHLKHYRACDRVQRDQSSRTGEMAPNLGLV